MSSQLFTYASKEDIESFIPLQRMGTTEDMAGLYFLSDPLSDYSSVNLLPCICLLLGVAIYLSSRAGAWVTGITVPVDGGNLLSSKL
jgi:hypothetical protein